MREKLEPGEVDRAILALCQTFDIRPNHRGFIVMALKSFEDYDATFTWFDEVYELATKKFGDDYELLTKYFLAALASHARSLKA